jgi:hypothetical protein
VAISVEQLAARYGRPVDEVMDICRRSGILVWGASTPLNEREAATVATQLGLAGTAPGGSPLPPASALPAMPAPQGPSLITPPTPAKKGVGGRQILLCLVAVVAGIGLGRLAVNNLLGDSAENEARDTIEDLGEWEPFAVDGQFTVDMPGEPELVSQQAPTAIGDMRVEMYQVLDADSGVVVAVAPIGALPADAIDPMLAGSVAGVAEGVGGTVVSDQPTDAGGYPARDAEIAATSSGQPIVVFARVAFHGDRLIQLQSMGLDGNRDDVLAGFNRLVDTFVPLAG